MWANRSIRSPARIIRGENCRSSPFRSTLQRRHLVPHGRRLGNDIPISSALHQNGLKNGGKRQGLRVSFALAHAGDVLVTMDSDSVVERDALRSLVTPIAVDVRIGAVAGNVKVLNRSAGILPRMMRASFVLAFDFTRAYQSRVRSVLCTPGAFSAYRRTAVEAVLTDWNNQSWMGKPSTIAEDRALSNLILREGHEVVFQSDAVVWTNVPTGYKQMAKMYQRWERGNLRENITYGKFCMEAFPQSGSGLTANVEWALELPGDGISVCADRGVAALRDHQSVFHAEVPRLHRDLRDDHAGVLLDEGEGFGLHLRGALQSVLVHVFVVGGAVFAADVE